jgi:hexosaminidase
MKYLIFILTLISTNLLAQVDEARIAVIPKPVMMTLLPNNFYIHKNTPIYYSANKESKVAAQKWQRYIQETYSIHLSIKKITHLPQKPPFYFRISIADLSRTNNGCYSILADSGRVFISGDPLGLQYALTTMKQLAKLFKKDTLLIPACIINDYPRFPWRGMHLDVSRHFITADSIKKYIDYLAFYKMNIFHWHLTDDQGWRIEIKKYPKLTEVGAWRKGTLVGSFRSYPHIYDSIKHGGFYTQKEVKSIIKYAAERGITVVPEIEMPGHSLAALAAYPEYSCMGGKFEVAQEWGVFDDVYCTKDSVFTFLQNILKEVIELFPSTYIHIGGDECPKVRWKSCPICQRRMKDEGLKDEHQLQSWFVQRIEKYINSKGRKLIGWDEILEGGLAPNAAVMSWRGTQGGIDAATLKHAVVMTPGSPCYFDHYQGEVPSEPLAIGGYNPIEKVYQWEPIPKELPDSLHRFILGAQANVWTEYIPNFKAVEYMVLPRIAAMAEVLWSPASAKNWPNFQQRIIEHLNIYKQWNSNYALSLFNVKCVLSADTSNASIKAELNCASPSSNIYYSTDGSLPSTNSSVYMLPIIIDKSSELNAVAIDKDGSMGKVYKKRFDFSTSTAKPIVLLKQPDEKYNFGGAFTLNNGCRGTIPWTSKDWLGFRGGDMEVVIDLKESKWISNIIIGHLTDYSSWIHPPSSVAFEFSEDSIHWEAYTIDSSNQNIYNKDIHSTKVLLNNGKQARYIKVAARNAGQIPEGMPGAGNKAWLFIDEIEIY